MKKSFIALSLLFVMFGCQKKQEVQPAESVNKAKLLQLVNEIRQAGCTCGTTRMPAVPAISWNDLLEKAATNHSADMNTNDYFSHTSKDGRTLGQRVTAVGYVWRGLGENIAKGYANEEAVIQGWKNSAGHCENIMSVDMKEMGLGKSGDYWTQVLGKK